MFSILRDFGIVLESQCYKKGIMWKEGIYTYAPLRFNIV